MTIGQSIRFYREYNGMTLKEVSEKIHIPFQNIHRYEKGIYKPKRKRYIELVKAVHIPHEIASQFYRMESIEDLCA